MKSEIEVPNYTIAKIQAMLFEYLIEPNIKREYLGFLDKVSSLPAQMAVVA